MTKRILYTIFSKGSPTGTKNSLQSNLTRPGLHNRGIDRPDALKSILGTPALKKVPKIILTSPDTRADIVKPHVCPAKSGEGRRRGPTSVAVTWTGLGSGRWGRTAWPVPDWSGGGFKRP